MGQTEKQSLINSLTLAFAENYNLPVKDVKANVTEILQNYHISFSNEPTLDGDTSTNYLMQKFKDGKIATGMKDNTFKQYDIAVTLLERETKKQLADIEPDDLNRFLRDYGKKVSSVTLRSKYQLLSSIYNYLFQHRLINYNPILYVDSPKATVVYKQPVTESEIERLKFVCEHLPNKESVRDTAIIYTFLSTGCRVSELCNIKVGDVDFSTNTVKVLGKGNKERPVVLNEKTAYRLNLYLAQRKNLKKSSPLFAQLRSSNVPMSSGGMECVVKKIRRMANVDKVTCHSFRRYFATELRKRGVNVQMIASSLGHANLNQVNRYSLFNSDEMIRTVKASI